MIRSSAMRGRSTVAVSVLAAAAFLLSGCGSTVSTVAPDGTKTEIKAGFGNAITATPVLVQPDPAVVAAGQALGQVLVNRASDTIIQKTVDVAVTKASQ